MLQKDEWKKELEREFKQDNYPKWPNEIMLKTLFGNYAKQ